VERLRVLLAGDQGPMTESVGRLLATGCDVVGTVTDGRTLVAEAERLRADVIVLGRDGLAGVKAGETANTNGHDLTDRQREVLRLLVAGRSMKEAGRTLNIAARTVAFHKYEMMARLKLTSNAELIKYAVRHNIA
jgi:DNA-binding NarL/FixJ family response regulator